MKLPMKNSTIKLIATIIPFSANIFAQSPQIIQLINNVSGDSIALYIRQLSGDTSCVIGGQPYTIVSRHKNQPGNDKASQYIYEKFQSFGLQVQYETFSSTGKNVISTKPGLNDSQAYFVICGHYDDMPSGTTAPGADDNASGTATVLELARVFSQYNFNYTIKFICFDEEEQGLVGSNYYATQARNRNDSIIGVINLDMTAYDANNDGMVDVHSNSVANTAQIANEWISNIYQYGIALTPRTVQSQPYSDHYSFQQKNYGATLIIEYDLEFNPRYHTVNDKFQYLNMNFAHKIAQVTAATAAEFIQIQSSNSVNITTNDGWNLLSIPIQPLDGRKSVLFPTSISHAYGYDQGYLIKDTLETGKGYWLKFNSPQNHVIQGQQLTQLQIQLKQGWNLIGTLASTIPVNSITTIPPNIIASPFYEYSGSYSPVENIMKGKGYWVKSYQNGIMNLVSSGKIQSSNYRFGDFDYELIFLTRDKQGKLYLTYSDIDRSFYELPPLPPSGNFDVRFSSNILVEKLENNVVEIKISGDDYPVSIRLNSKNSEAEQGLILVLNEGNSNKEVVLTNGSHLIMNSKVNKIIIKKISYPKNFTLYQNYPNPFNPTTLIQFYIPQNTHVEIDIYDLTGQLLEALIKDELKAGFHKVEFNGERYSSGVYFYEIKTPQFRDIKKMLLIK